MNLSAVLMPDAQFPQHVAVNAVLAGLVAVEHDLLPASLAIQQVTGDRGAHVAMGIATQLDGIDAGSKPFQCAGLRYHELLQ